MKHLLFFLFLVPIISVNGLRAQVDVDAVSTRQSLDGVFQIAGTSYDGVQFVAQMADQMVRMGRNFLPVPKNPPQGVMVKLIPAEISQQVAPFTVRAQAGGEVIVLVKWGPDTRFEDVCQALASGLLQRTAIWHHGLDAASKVPDWFEMAFGQKLIVTIRPAMIDRQRMDALETPPMTFEEITRATGPYGAELPEYQADSGWLFRFLEGQVQSNEEFRRICSAFLANLNPNAIVVKAFPDRFESENDIELWWAVGFQATVLGRQPPFASQEESRELITSMAFVTFQAEDEEDIRVAGQNLWEWREDPDARLAMEQRVREAKIELQKINPVYFNSLLSLGLLFEAALAGNEATFSQALAQFALDFQSAQSQELEMRRLLRW